MNEFKILLAIHENIITKKGARLHEILKKSLTSQKIRTSQGVLATYYSLDSDVIDTKDLFYLLSVLGLYDNGLYGMVLIWDKQYEESFGSPEEYHITSRIYIEISSPCIIVH